MSASLDKAIFFLRESVAPRANEIDASLPALRDVFAKWGETGLAALRVGPEYGGPGLTEPEFREFQEEAARASGAFAFLQTQHQSAASMLLRSENEDLKRAYLPAMCQGKIWVGIGFSQLRRPGPPVLRAEECADGYRLEGTAPWVTGKDIFGEWLAGAALPDGQAVFGMVPFVPEAGLTFSDPMRLVAMESAQTVEANLDGWMMPREKAAFLRPAGWIANNDRINITLQGHFALGCARAGLDVVSECVERAPNSERATHQREAHTRLEQELEQCRTAIEASQADPNEQTTPERLALRAWAIELAVRCAHAGVVSSAGAASHLSNPAQRVYREALIFSVSAQTTDIMAATLRRLVR